MCKFLTCVCTRLLKKGTFFQRKGMFWILVIGYWTPYGLLGIGYWVLAIGRPAGYWVMVIGYWLLGIGYWVLVIGYGIAHRSPERQ
jgi:hypothetical protein